MYTPTARTKLRRLPERGAYDRGTVHAILDEGVICHVGFVVDGQPYALPTGYTRVGETLYLHGSTGSRLGLRPDMDVCVTVTLLDGIVLARAAFHHSFQYRSVMVLGRTRLVRFAQARQRTTRRTTRCPCGLASYPSRLYPVSLFQILGWIRPLQCRRT